jgi:hypothetical protein
MGETMIMEHSTIAVQRPRKAEHLAERTRFSRQISIVGSPSTATMSIPDGDSASIGFRALQCYLSTKGVSGAPPASLVESFTEEFLEEVPPGNLTFPVTILNRWYHALTVAREPRSVSVV